MNEHTMLNHKCTLLSILVIIHMSSFLRSDWFSNSFFRPIFVLNFSWKRGTSSPYQTLLTSPPPYLWTHFWTLLQVWRFRASLYLIWETRPGMSQKHIRQGIGRASYTLSVLWDKIIIKVGYSQLWRMLCVARSVVACLVQFKREGLHMRPCLFY